MLGYSPYILRDCRVEDLDRLHEIDRLCFAPDIAYSRAELYFHLHHRDAVSRLAERSGAIVGFAVGRILRRRGGHVITLDVVQEARRQGIGRALLQALHAEFAARGAATATLEVSMDNAGARRFYESLGYRAEGLLPGYYGGHTDACRMVCPLARII